MICGSILTVQAGCIFRTSPLLSGSRIDADLLSVGFDQIMEFILDNIGQNAGNILFVRSFQYILFHLNKTRTVLSTFDQMLLALVSVPLILPNGIERAVIDGKELPHLALVLRAGELLHDAPQELADLIKQSSVLPGEILHGLLAREVLLAELGYELASNLVLAQRFTVRLIVSLDRCPQRVRVDASLLCKAVNRVTQILVLSAGLDMVRHLVHDRRPQRTSTVLTQLLRTDLNLSVLVLCNRTIIDTLNDLDLSAAAFRQPVEHIFCLGTELLGEIILHKTRLLLLGLNIVSNSRSVFHIRLGKFHACRVFESLAGFFMPKHRIDLSVRKRLACERSIGKFCGAFHAVIFAGKVCTLLHRIADRSCACDLRDLIELNAKLAHLVVVVELSVKVRSASRVLFLGLLVVLSAVLTECALRLSIGNTSLVFRCDFGGIIAGKSALDVIQQSSLLRSECRFRSVVQRIIDKCVSARKQTSCKGTARELCRHSGRIDDRVLVIKREPLSILIINAFMNGAGGHSLFKLFRAFLQAALHNIAPTDSSGILCQIIHTASDFNSCVEHTAQKRGSNRCGFGCSVRFCVFVIVTSGHRKRSPEAWIFHRRSNRRCNTLGNACVLQRMQHGTRIINATGHQRENHLCSGGDESLIDAARYRAKFASARVIFHEHLLLRAIRLGLVPVHYVLYRLGRNHVGQEEVGRFHQKRVELIHASHCIASNKAKDISHGVAALLDRGSILCDHAIFAQCHAAVRTAGLQELLQFYQRTLMRFCVSLSFSDSIVVFIYANLICKQEVAVFVFCRAVSCRNLRKVALKGRGVYHRRVYFSDVFAKLPAGQRVLAFRISTAYTGIIPRSAGCAGHAGEIWRGFLWSDFLPAFALVSLLCL